MSSIQPYTWRQLRRLTGREAALLQSVAAYMSPQVATHAFRHHCQTLLTELLHAPCMMTIPEASVIDRAAATAQLPAMGYFAIIGVAPGPQKIVVDIDSVLGTHVVESLLGGGGDDAPPPIRMAREPTELELGVMSFAVLRLLETATGHIEDGASLALVLDAMVGRNSALDAAFEGSEQLVQLGVRVQLGRVKGYCRILLPESFVDQRFGKAIADSHAEPTLLPRMRRRLELLKDFEHTFVVHGARLDLADDDIANLEVGDIVLFDEHQLAMTPTGATGSVSMRPIAGRHSHVTAQLGAEAGVLQITIDGIVEQNTAEGAPMAQESDDNLPATEGLLRDMDASVAVELGRIRLNTAQVVRLREGQVLKLARGAADPVDLVIRGKVFGRGELVEVDGEMGVRLTQITGEN